MAVLIEVVGKFAHTFSKLEIATDKDVRSYWRRERDQRFLTCLSVIERLYLLERRRG